jgi:hypothetical protein
MERVCGTFGGGEYIHTWFVGCNLHERLFLGARHRLEDNIKMNLKEIGWQHED